MAGTLRVLREEEIGCVAGGSMTGAGDPNWMPPSATWAFDGVPVVAGSSFGLGNSSTFGGHAAYVAAQQAANEQAWAAASTPSGFNDYSDNLYTAPTSTENLIVVNAAALYEIMPSSSIFDALAFSAYNAGQGISLSDILLYWKPDGDIEDFKEYLVENTDMTIEELGQSYVATSTIGEDKFALVWDSDNIGQIYRIHDQWLDDDTYTIMGNIQITGITASASTGASMSNTGGSLNIGNGQSVNFLLLPGPPG